MGLYKARYFKKNSRASGGYKTYIPTKRGGTEQIQIVFPTKELTTLIQDARLSASRISEISTLIRKQIEYMLDAFVQQA